MPQRFTFILVVLLLLISGNNFGQTKQHSFSKKNMPSVYGFFDQEGVIGGRYSRYLQWQFQKNRASLSGSITQENSTKQGMDLPLLPFISTALPGDYYTRSLGFFCRKEIALEKIVPVPLRFRLGSVDYTDRMEGKNR
ncbi:MAG: hypothetical protein GC171_11690 [Terrimonas sp.]|nr:hypothetical protein [Terrimonas sp.]